MVQAPSNILTLAEFLQLPETKPANGYLAGLVTRNPCLKGNTVQFKENLFLPLTV